MFPFSPHKSQHLRQESKTHPESGLTLVKLVRPLSSLGLVSFLSLLFLVLFFSPYNESSLTAVNWVRVGAFLFSLLIFVYCLFSVMLFSVKVLFFNPYDKSFAFKNSQRQGLLLGFGLVVLALMLLTKTFNLFTVALEIVLIVAIEVSFH